jgi:hypothetical protein
MNELTVRQMKRGGARQIQLAMQMQEETLQRQGVAARRGQDVRTVTCRLDAEIWPSKVHYPPPPTRLRHRWKKPKRYLRRRAFE